MGYVVRCSNLEAQHINHQTYIRENDSLVKLDKMTPETQEELRSFYYEENKSEEMIKYGKIHFSMNAGDY
jgi:DNA-directed RNA polymerase subunit F